MACCNFLQLSFFGFEETLVRETFSSDHWIDCKYRALLCRAIFRSNSGLSGWIRYFEVVDGSNIHFVFIFSFCAAVWCSNEAIKGGWFVHAFWIVSDRYLFCVALCSFCNAVIG